jgi:hypothetical protein
MATSGIPGDGDGDTLVAITRTKNLLELGRTGRPFWSGADVAAMERVIALAEKCHDVLVKAEEASAQMASVCAAVDALRAEVPRARHG